MRPPRMVVAAALLGALAAPALAQVDSAATARSDSAGAAPAPAGPAAPAARGAPAFVGWGKWVSAAVAVGFTALGVETHNGANGAFRSLIAYCGQTACTLAPDGRYADARAEATYQTVVRRDRAARAWLLAGQATAVGTAVLFVMDLMRPRGPANIPFSGLRVDTQDGVTRVGIRIPIRLPLGER